MNRASFQQLFGTELPIIQAPMAGVQSSALALAVGDAGGLGSLPCALLGPERVREELSIITSQSSKPFSINFFCHREPPADAQRESAWRAALYPYYEELGLDPQGVAPGPVARAFDGEVADVVEEFRPPVVSFHFGLPSPDLLGRVRSWGATVIASATTLEEALWLEDRGVDAIVAQGLEAGGHRGMFLSEDITTQIGTFALVPQIVAKVRVPVVAAGGIADARGISAAMALGAAGVQVGTAYLLCPEVDTSSVHRAALKSDSVRHTALTNLFTGRPSRGIVNRFIRELGPLNPAVPAFPRATPAITPLRRHAEAQGSGDFSPLWAGQNATGCREIPAAQLTRDLMAGGA